MGNYLLLHLQKRRWISILHLLDYYGFPFGFQKLRMLLIPKGFGIAGEIGVFALDAIVAGLIGGIFLVKKIVVIMADYIRAIGKIIRPT